MISLFFILFHARKHSHCDALWVLTRRIVQSVVLRMGHYTRTFTLVAKWRNPPKWHICNICHSRHKHFVSTFRVILNTFCKELFLLWGPASNIYDTCGDIHENSFRKKTFGKIILSPMKTEVYYVTKCNFIQNVTSLSKPRSIYIYICIYIYMNGIWSRLAE